VEGYQLLISIKPFFKRGVPLKILFGLKFPFKVSFKFKEPIYFIKGVWTQKNSEDRRDTLTKKPFFF